MPERMSAGISIRRLAKSYATGNTALRVLQGVDLEARPGEFVSLFGPNGCGKTTILNIVAGLTDSDSGEICIDGRPPGGARIGYVFQTYELSLLPWRMAVDNIALALEAFDGTKRSRRLQVREFLKRTGISVPQKHYPYQMSGGQKQLTALARALIAEPDVLLMDEPFGSLDFDTRMRMADELLGAWQTMGVTTLFVSHEIDEAIYLADRLYILGPMPTKVVDVIDIDLPRPRHREMLQGSQLFELRSRAIGSLREAVK